MDEDEYKDLKEFGVIKSPSWSKNIGNTQNIFKTLVPMIDPTKSVCVMGLVNPFDIIGENTTKNDSETEIEHEVVMIKGSKITNINKVFEYGLDDLIDDYGKEVTEILPIDPSEICNGFSWKRVLKDYSGINVSKTPTPFNQRMVDGLINGYKKVLKFGEMGSVGYKSIKKSQKILRENFTDLIEGKMKIVG